MTRGARAASIASVASVAIGVAAWIAACTRPATAPDEAVERVAIRVTSGRVVASPSGLLHIDAPTTRFVAPGSGGAATLQFTYRGPTAEARPLASGELRRQIGIKLRARDGCNVVYAMWRLAPQPRLVVSVKRNEGASTHIECGAGGYENVRPLRSEPVPHVTLGSSHTMEAAIEGDRLRVLVDGREAWEGVLPREAFEFDGPAGLRTDNVDVELRFTAAPR